jgi:hypothetical protein
MESTYLQTVASEMSLMRQSVIEELIRQKWQRQGQQPSALQTRPSDRSGEIFSIDGESVALFYLPRFTGRSLILDYQILADWVDCSRLPQRHGYPPAGTDQGNQSSGRGVEND